MSDQDLRPNPYVGLRPFFAEDSLYFFGRDEQTAELLDILRDHRFLGVVGSSGSGKSSLVRAGLLPALLGGFLVHDRDRWRKVQMKPGDAPMANLAAGLLKATRAAAFDAKNDEHMAAERQAAITLADDIREGHTGAVIDFLAPRMEANANLFLLVDQFEEIFAFRGVEDDDSDEALDLPRRQDRARRRAEAADFVDLLLTLAAQRDQPIYVVLTMRTDFLGDCDLFYGLPEALNLGRYLVPRMNREQLRDAVECPALLRGASISPRLSDHVLNELGDRFDRLPLLQHALMRTWDAWHAAGEVGPIDLQHFESVDGRAGALDQSAGGLEGALDKDAEGALQGLDLGVTKGIFQRLTDTDATQRRVRSPARIKELMAVAGADRDVVEGIVRRFEEDGRSFLHRSDDGTPENPRVDISHESLIRQWTRLRNWVDDERLSRDLYKKLVERSQSGALLQDPELQRMLDWWHEATPSAAWAKRYSVHDADFDQAKRYLDESEGKRNSDLEDKRRVAEAERLNERRKLEEAIERAEEQKVARLRQRTIARRAYAALALALAGLVFAWFKDLEAQKERQARTANALVMAAGDLDGGIPRALLFGAAGIRHGHTFETQESLRKVLLAEPHLDAFLAEPGSTTPLAVVAATSVAFSPDGATLASGAEDGSVTLWDVDRNLRIGEPLAGHEPGHIVTSVAFSPDGRILASGSQDKTVILWDTATRAKLHTLTGHVAEVSSVAFSPDGKRLASGSWDGSVIQWDLTGRQIGKPLAEVKAQNKGPAWVMSVAFSPDGSTIAAVDIAGQLLLWNATTGQLQPKQLKELKEYDGTPLAVSSLTFSPNGELLVVGSHGGSVTLWNLVLWEQREQLPLHQGSVQSVAFSPDSRFFASAGADGISLFDQRTNRRDALPAQMDVTSIAFSSRGKLASSGEDGTLILWDAPSRKVTTLGRHPKPVRSVAVSPDGRLVAAGDEAGAAALWDIAAGQVSLAPDSEWHTDYVRSVAFSPDGKRFASGSDDTTVIVWDVAGPKLLHVLKGHSGYVTSVAFNPADGKTLASGSEDNTVRLWDTESGQQLRVLEGHAYPVTSIAFSNDGKMLASGSDDSTVRLWDAASGRELGVLEGHTNSVTSVAFSADGTTLASGSRDKTVILWNVAEHGKRGTLAAHRRSVMSVAFSRDGTLASGGDDNTVILWDVASLRMLGKPAKRHFAAVTSVAFSPNGTTLVSGSADNTVVLWDDIWWRADVDSWLKQVCRTANRNLTPDEWDERVGSDVSYDRYGKVCESLPVPREAPQPDPER